VPSSEFFYLKRKLCGETLNSRPPDTLRHKQDEGLRNIATSGQFSTLNAYAPLSLTQLGTKEIWRTVLVRNLRGGVNDALQLGESLICDKSKMRLDRRR